jgi:peptidoglycan/xylan/chitin deacetylase (PgdA/CDA1 family)
MKRGRDLPLPLLLVLAIGAVLVERVFASRQRALLVALALLVCVAIGGFGSRLAGRSEAARTPTAPAAAALPSPTVQAASTVRPTRTTAAQPTAMATGVTPTASVEPIPTLAPSTGGEQQPIVATALETPTAAPSPAATFAPRGTTVIPILMYHYVRTVTDPKDTIGINLSVTPEKFAAQMQYLAENGYTTLTMREVHAILAGAMPLPPKPIALTFDDGYRDFYTAAWPVLRKHNFKATAYIVTSAIGLEPYMTWAMLQELDATGRIELGAHTRSHPDLRALGKEKRWDEIVGSKAILEEGLGHPIASFCYPAGYYTAEVIADVRRAGYLTAVTTAHGSKQHIQSAFELPRIRVHGPDSLAGWAGKLP